MDPRIASGFSILGNALMPDPSKLAQAEVYRSQMLENQAMTGKLGAETDALKRTAENLALLQDILANQNSTSGDIISRGVGAGLTNDPSDIPRLAIGTIGSRNLDVNDPGSFSRALLATGTVAGQANTPEGFAADQARLEREAVAKDITEQRGQNIESTDRRYDADLDRLTDLDIQKMQGDIETQIADADRALQKATDAATLAHNYYETSIESRDRASAVGAEAQWRALERDRLSMQARLDRLSNEALRLEDYRTRSRDVDATNATNVDIADKRGAFDVLVKQTENLGEYATKELELGGAGGGGGDPLNKVEFGTSDRIFNDILTGIAHRFEPDTQFETMVDVNNTIVENTAPVPERTIKSAMRAAFQFYGPDNPVAAGEAALAMIRWNPDNGRWEIDTGALPGGGVTEMPDVDTSAAFPPKPAATATPPKPNATTGTMPAKGTGKAEQVMVDTRNKRKAYLENGFWFYVDDNTPVPGQ